MTKSLNAQLSREQQIAALEKDWAQNPRWKSVKRGYSAADVVRLRGSLQPEYTLAQRGAEKLWELVNGGAKKGYVNAFGAITAGQAMQQAKAGLEAVYLSGWQVAADGNTSETMYPDQSLYAYDSVPTMVRRINNTFKRADEIQWGRGVNPGDKEFVDYFLPIVADAEAGFGGVLNAFELMKNMIAAGAAGVHFEDQLAAVKKCGHMGGKVLVPTQEAIEKLIAARFAADVMGVPTIILARTDAEAANLITSNHDANDQAFLTKSLAFPSAEHWFGVDDLGRDFFTRIVYGARVSLGIGLSAALFSLVLGMPMGALAGYLGGRFDWVIMRIIELFSVVPPLLAALLLATITRGGVWAIVLISGLFGWVNVCLLVRAQVKSFREKEFIMAARALGASPWHIVWRHLIPNSVSPIIVGFVLAIPLAMMLEASLSFLGIGVQPPTPSWGQMINVGMNFMFFYWHMAVFPTAALAITILAASLLGDGLRDAFDPTLKGR